MAKTITRPPYICANIYEVQNKSVKIQPEADKYAFIHTHALLGIPTDASFEV